MDDTFWERVDKTSDTHGCWLWTGPKNRDGYGQVWWNGVKSSSHRRAFLLSGRPIPEGLQLAHSNLCKGKRHCCNPDHLTPKTRSQNQLDKHRDGTYTQAKLTPEQVTELRAKATYRGAQRTLAKEYGVSESTISRRL